MDALSDVLRAAKLNGAVFLQSRFTAPWCMVSKISGRLCQPYLGPNDHLIPFHFVVEGELRVAVEGEAPLTLSAGDVVLLPGNDEHVMGSDLSLTPVRGDTLIEPDRGALSRIEYGGGGKVTRMICGYLGYDRAYGNPIVATLPRLMKLTVEDTGAGEWIRSTFQYAAAEVANGRPGSETVLAKLSELLFVEAVRRYVETLPEDQAGWLAGLRDPPVARALALMHGDVKRPWNVEELGRGAGLSRSALAERFTRVIGMSPMQYLAHWRMQMAAQQLKNTSASLSQVAEQVGYESGAAFSRAFKKTFGDAPGAWRRAGTA
jgi:AraC-like DNA-binding protein